MRAALGDKNIDFVAVNDLTSAHTLAHLLVRLGAGQPARVDAKEDRIAVDGDETQVLSFRDRRMPWKDLGVDGLRVDRAVHQPRRRG
jgi:glyceraldehyde 3-phosphate dehydrogenase